MAQEINKAYEDYLVRDEEQFTYDGGALNRFAQRFSSAFDEEPSFRVSDKTPEQLRAEAALRAETFAQETAQDEAAYLNGTANAQETTFKPEELSGAIPSALMQDHTGAANPLAPTETEPSKQHEEPAHPLQESATTNEHLGFGI